MVEPIPEIDPDAILKPTLSRARPRAEPEEPDPESSTPGGARRAGSARARGVPAAGARDDERRAPASRPASGEPLDLNSASYEDLRELGLSVTQTGRVLAYRERVGGFNSLDDLDAIPGFPHEFLAGFKTQLRL